MRTIPLRCAENFKTSDVIRQVIERPFQGISLDELRKRVRVLDAVDAAGDADALTLEDADYTTLAGAIQTMQFSMASKPLLSIIDEILNAAPAGSPPQP